MNDLDLFGDQPAASDPPPLEEGRAASERRRNARRRGHRKGHPCTCCGRRTYRRIRRYPAQGYEDARCQTCADTGRWPDQHTDRRTRA